MPSFIKPALFKKDIQTTLNKYVNHNQISELLKSCEAKSGSFSERAINVQMLHRILNEELAALQGSSALGQRQMIQQEIKK